MGQVLDEEGTQLKNSSVPCVLSVSLPRHQGTTSVDSVKWLIIYYVSYVSLLYYIVMDMTYKHLERGYKQRFTRIRTYGISTL